MTEPRSQCTAAGVVQTVDTWYATTTDGDTVVLALPDAPAIWLVHRPHAQVYWQTEGRRGPDPLAGQRPPAPRDGAGPPPQPENGRGGPARCGGCGAPLRMGGDGGLLSPLLPKLEHLEEIANRGHIERYVGVTTRHHRIGQIIATAGGQRREVPVALDELQHRDVVIINWLRVLDTTERS